MNAATPSSAETQTSTIDYLIDLFKTVVAENAFRDKTEVAAIDWGPETTIESAGVDSFDFVEVIFKIEDHFGIEIDYNANKGASDLRTIGDLAAAIDRLVARKRAA